MSALHIRRPWRRLSAEAVGRLEGQLGVYELADSDGQVFYIGYAGGRSRFGLRGEIEAHLEGRQGRETLFRYEVNMQYLTRHEELLMVFWAENGRLPAENRGLRRRLGRLSPA